MTTICFDFDGVLASYDGWKDGAIGEPIPNGVKLAKLCHEVGYKIVINTCRTHPQHGLKNRHDQIITIHNWLHNNDVPYDSIQLEGKPIADVYIDDRGMYFDQDLGKTMKTYDKYMFDMIQERVQ